MAMRPIRQVIQLLHKSRMLAYFPSWVCSQKTNRTVTQDRSIHHTIIFLLFEHCNLGMHELASLSCVSRDTRDVCDEEDMWMTVCERKWPSLSLPKAKSIIRSSGGYKKFLRNLHSIGGELQLHIPSNLIENFFNDIMFFVDVRHFGKSLKPIFMDGSSFTSTEMTRSGVYFKWPSLTVNYLHAVDENFLKDNWSKEYFISCIAVRCSDKRSLQIMGQYDTCRGWRSGMFCSYFQCTYMFPGIFQYTEMSLNLSLTTAFNKTKDRSRCVKNDSILILRNGHLPSFSAKNITTNLHFRIKLTYRETYARGRRFHNMHNELLWK